MGNAGDALQETREHLADPLQDSIEKRPRHVATIRRLPDDGRDRVVYGGAWPHGNGSDRWQLWRHHRTNSPRPGLRSGWCRRRAQGAGHDLDVEALGTDARVVVEDHLRDHDEW